MLLSPTDQWSPRRLLIPNMGSVVRPLVGDLIVDDPAVAQWLIDQGYATAAAISPESAAQSALPEEIPAWMDRAIAFLNAESEDAIAAIRGISALKAKELVEQRPFDQSTIKTALTSSQLRSLQVHFSTGQQTHDA